MPLTPNQSSGGLDSLSVNVFSVANFYDVNVRMGSAAMIHIT
jgi:hypothetical protein